MVCKHCKKEFEVDYRDRKQKYCSYDCYKEDHHEIRVCEACHKDFKVRKSRKTQRFCSVSCSLSVTKKGNKNCVGRKLSKLTREKIGRAQIGRISSLEERKKKSEASKQMWRRLKNTQFYIDKVNEMKNGKALMMRKNASVNYRDTDIERLVENWLLNNGVLYVKQYWTGCSFADFWLPEDNIIVECDGTYWHSKPEVVERDKKHNEWLENNDYFVYRFTDTQIKNNLNECMSSLPIADPGNYITVDK